MATKKKVVTVESVEELFTIETEKFTLCIDCGHRSNWMPGSSLCGFYKSPVDGKPYRKCKDLRRHSPICEMFTPTEEYMMAQEKKRISNDERRNRRIQTSKSERD